MDPGLLRLFKRFLRLLNSVVDATRIALESTPGLLRLTPADFGR